MTTGVDVDDAHEVPHLPEDLAAVCLDANAMSRGLLNLTAIEDLVEVIESQELDVPVMIPETVVWEWAEHLAADIADVTTTVHRLQLQASSAGVPLLVPDGWPAELATDTVVDAVMRAVSGIEGVEVLPLRPDSIAVEALRDQVLLRGPARRKKDVKTGAADSAAFRLIDAERFRVGGTFLVVSADQDARLHFSGERDVRLTPSISRAKAGIVAMRKGSEMAVDRVRQAVSTRLPRMTRKELGDPEVGPENGPTPENGRRLNGVRILNLTYGLVAVEAVIDVSDVEVSRSDGYAAVVVEALVSIERDLQVLSDRSDAVEMDIDSFGGLRATLELSAESDNGVDWDFIVDRVRLL